MRGRLLSTRSAIVVATMLLIVLTATFGSRLALQSTSALSLLPDDFRTGGGAGLVRWAERLELPTRPLQAPLWEVESELPDSGHCAITAGNGSWQPLGDQLDPDQWSQIRRWVESGNALIVVTSSVGTLPKGITDLFTGTSSKFPPLFTAADDDEQFFEPADDVTQLPTWWGGNLAVAARGPRLTRAPDEWVMAGSTDAAALVQQTLGAGRIYLLLDEHAWSNAGLDRGDNAATLARILQRELRPGSAVAIDQYRHGRGRVESFATFLLRLPGAGAFCTMLLLIGAVWIWARNQRLGPVDEFHETERRSAQEYIEAVAQMNQRARAAPLAVQAVADRVNYLLHQRGGLTDVGRQLLDRAHDHVARQVRPASPAVELKLVSELIELRKKHHGTRPDSRAD